VGQSNHITVNKLRHTTRIVDQIFPEPAIAPTYECAARVGQGFNREGSQRIAALTARSLLSRCSGLKLGAVVGMDSVILGTPRRAALEGGLKS
jgi:hypothetical protein